MSVDVLPPLYAFEVDNHAAWVVTFCVTFFIYSLVAVAAKLIVRFHLLSLQTFDYALMLGTVFLFVQTALVIAACNSGLGRHIDTLAVDELIRYQKVGKFHSKSKAVIVSRSLGFMCLHIYLGT